MRRDMSNQKPGKAITSSPAQRGGGEQAAFSRTHHVSERPIMRTEDWEELDKIIHLEQKLGWARNRLIRGFFLGCGICVFHWLPWFFGFDALRYNPSRPYQHWIPPLTIVLLILFVVDGVQKYLSCWRDLKRQLRMNERMRERQ